MRILTAAMFPLVLAATCLNAFAWNPPRDTVGPLTVAIEPFEDVQALETPVPVHITLTNTGQEALPVSLRVGVIDQWRVEGENPRLVTVPSGGNVTTDWVIVGGKGTYAAHYPVHAYADFAQDGKTVQAHAIFIFQVARAAVMAPKAVSDVTVEALKAEKPITVDGDLQEWANAVPLALGDAQRSVGSLPAAEFNAVAMLLHNADTLYLGLRVTDREISGTDTTSRDFVDSDYVRLYLAARPPRVRKAARLDSEDLLLAFNPFAAGGPVWKIPDYGVPTRPVADPNAISCAARKTAAGYEAEIALPLSLVGAGLGDGSALGFNLMIGNALGGQRVAELTLGATGEEYWMDPRSYVTLHLSALTRSSDQSALPILPVTGAGSVPLQSLGVWRVSMDTAGGPPQEMPVGWLGTEEKTGATFLVTNADRPDRKSSFGIHPPWRGGARGSVWADARLSLPKDTPIVLSFSTAIRDNSATEPPSDGVEWRVYVAPESGEFHQLFQRFSDAKKWEPAEIDLSAYAGQTVTLRLWNGPGPKGNTTCDGGFWGDPTLTVGEIPREQTPEEIKERMDRALERAKDALRGNKDQFQWLVENAAGKFGVGWAAGPNGFADGSLAFVSEDGRSFCFEHFLMSIDGQDVRDWRSGRRVVGGRANWTPDGKMTTIVDMVRGPGDTVTTWASMFAEQGAFKIQFSMPTQVRNKRGEPRFTLLGVGPCDQMARRVYAGFGNVIQDPGRFTLNQGGFGLSTRHVGMDFANGLSLLQASDVFPYRFEVDPEHRLYSLQTGHDATLILIPSTKGAFAAARVYRDVVGFRPAGGVAKLKGKFAFDWWGSAAIADDIRRAAAYGMTDSIFIHHNWQRWGYDYRLPDIYPPNCDPQVWADLVAACKDNGILFAPHDNYIDFYPDASGYSYKYILFNSDGTPQRAWYNRGRDAQSYRWAPGAYWPWLERNIRLVKEGFAPTGYFIDVFSAIPLLDYYDQEGNFHTKMECARAWGETFDYVREHLGDNAPQISEAGHDGLIGHLDGCQSDHYSADRWVQKFGDAERTPWHDMATHGSFVLLAGGLGPRYSNDKPESTWATDDYLSNTVMGGRNPMAAGPCPRGAVLTYWLQHDICKELANQSLEAHEFVGDNIHRQHTTFGGGGQVWCNRGEEPWEVQGVVLPKYGYWAQSGNVTSGIILKDGISAHWAQSPGVLFADSRPQSMDLGGRAPVKTSVTSFKYLGNGEVECRVEWDVLKPLPKGYVVFTHMCHDSVKDQGEKILFQPPMGLAPELLQQVGLHVVTLRFRFSDSHPEGQYRLRYGLYAPANGSRLVPIALLEGDRVRGGLFDVTKVDGKVTRVTYTAETQQGPPLNTAGKMLDFGPVVTNGAFRLLYTGDDWRLLPLQGSLAFRAELRLNQLGATGKRVTAVEGLSQDGQKQSDEEFVQEGDTLRLDLSAEAFSYRIRLQ